MLAQFQTSNALHWLGRQLFNRTDPAAFFDPLLERIDPMLAQQTIRARVVSITTETADTRTFVLKPASRWQGFRAGQHIALTLDINGVRRTRTFSLSSTPSQWQENGTIALTIKRIKDGLVTGWMHDCLTPGETLSVSEAFGDFGIPEAAEPSLYIVGGSGITPVLSHLETMAAAGSHAPVTLLYYVRTRNDVIASKRLAVLAEQWPALTLSIFTTNEPGKAQRLSDQHLHQVPGISARRCYLCGPEGLMDLASDLLDRRDVPESRIHCTRFSAPPMKDAVELDADSLGGQVQFAKSGKQTDSRGDASLLDIAEASGLSPKHGCRMGICHQCSCTKTSGTVINRLTGKTSGNGEETIQLCVSVPAGAVAIDL
ncbi:ferredoxin reductase [Marinobacter confluentis]|uniref:Ferredoxin reductase n=1 Tax=Marinobacter confluentis TaxID=1697557 RepID=A0A4Z1BT71_9GAMM|nr:ferredoxin reductase [Marinobacter confluentis]TGN40399.1 ferredoxin reductase [Marinobacter confluentis]